MKKIRKSPHEFNIEDLDKELISRGGRVSSKRLFIFKDKNGTPARDIEIEKTKKLYCVASVPDAALNYLSTWDVGRILKVRTGHQTSIVRGSGDEDIKEKYEIAEEPVLTNARCTAPVIMKDSLIHRNGGNSILAVKNYGKTFHLAEIESFYDQPIATGHLSTGFLIEKNTIVTSGDFINERNVQDVRVIFGYHMEDSVTPVTQFLPGNIYKGVEIIKWSGSPQEGQWLWIRLDREVDGPLPAMVSKERIMGTNDREIYTLGYPLGLPMKYAPGVIWGNIKSSYFNADLNLYGSAPGSPIFDKETHQVIGIVIQNQNTNFRWTEKGWITIDFANPDHYSVRGVHCLEV